MRYAGSCALAVLLLASSAYAAPGLGEKVYGATVERGVTGLGARYGRLAGGHDDGEAALALEVSHGFSDRIYGAAVAEFEWVPMEGRRLEALAVEGIYTLGEVEAIALNVAVYGEYEIGLHGPDKVEAKLLLEHEQGPFDGRLNLTAAKLLQNGSPVELSYAASADWEIVDALRLGGAIFGDLSTTEHLHAEHFVGPVMKYEVEQSEKGDLGIEAGYLFAFGDTREIAKGQIRILVEYGMKF